ncbi:hypothetical protein [Streptomyces sp. URMC 129]|uniref:hypothetical protein n=1 Tax=Streptomyces sp. URMC 129 TaxID=3423407 RepID=UPI003F1BB915
MSMLDLVVTTVSSYQDHHWPVPEAIEQRPVTSGAVTASASRTSERVSQPSRSASVQWRNKSRS